MSCEQHSEQEPLAIAAEVTAAGLIIRVAGELDLSTVPKLEAALLTAVEAPDRPAEVRVDMGATSFIDAAGISALLGGREASDRVGVDFSVVNPSKVVWRLLQLLGLTDTLLDVTPRRRGGHGETTLRASPTDFD